MTRGTCRPAGVAIIIVCAALSLAGCGRKGGLEPPPAVGAVPTDAPAQSVLGANAPNPWLDGDTPAPRPQPPPAPTATRKTFPLDPILN